MALSPGSRFGQYEVVAQIGAGGMGEVYRATDVDLKRSVAIKALPATVGADPDRLARFEREAVVLAALDHPNIAQIFGLERDGATTGLVMELVEGSTLADRIASGPLPVEEALQIGVQIAEALEAAHERGIVHRDLKPANIKIRPDGRVKVLDFGIAKALAPVGLETARVPAVSGPALTETGMIIGTAAYMSPEQARGLAVDTRTDIWAFGVVLFEMITGQPAFPGRDMTETLAAVLKSEPDWSAVPVEPPLLRPFLKQCLRKDPRNRLHHIADMRLALAGAYDVPAAPAPARVHGLRWIVAGLAIALVAAAVGAAYVVGDSAGVSSTASIRQLTFRNGAIGRGRFASDGEVIVYAAAWDGEPYRLFTTRIDGFQSRPLDLPPADLLALAPDNTLAIALTRPSVDGFTPQGLLAEVDLAGGAPRIRDDGVLAADFGPDGALAAIVRDVGGQVQLEFPPGTVIERASIIPFPRVSPDGDRICFSRDWRSLMHARRGGAPEELVGGLSRLNGCAWHPERDEIWFTHAPTSSTHTNLEAVDLATGTRRTLMALGSFGMLNDVGADGTALVALGSLRFAARGAPTGGREIDLSVFDASRVGVLDAAGTTALIVENSTGAQGSALFLKPLDHSPPIQLGPVNPLAMTTDGETIAVLGDGSAFVGSGDTITLLPTGAGAARSVRLPVMVSHVNGNVRGTNVPHFRTADFSDDGRRLMLPFAQAAGDEPRVYVHDFDAGWTKPITPPGVTGPAAFSADGRFVASNETEGLFVYSVDTDERRELPGGPDPGRIERWDATGERLYFIEQEGANARIVERSVATGERRTIREIRAPDPAGVTRFDPWVSRSGEAYAYTLDRWLHNLFVIEGLR